MYAQLGTIVFDGMTSFVSFSSDEEAIVVEQALIGRKAKLEGVAIGLRTISLSLFLHQEFCQVAQEISKLRSSKDSFEILKLLWGNGQIEGEFVITQLSEAKVFMDGLGNTISATVNITLKESYDEDRLNKKQADAQKNAFATGNKRPPTKSNRVNPQLCQQRISQLNYGIKANAGALDSFVQGYTNIPRQNLRIKYLLQRITEDTQKVYNESVNSSSCANSVSGLSAAAKNVMALTPAFQGDIQQNETTYANLIQTPLQLRIKSDNANLQQAIKAMDQAIVNSSLVKSSITLK